MARQRVDLAASQLASSLRHLGQSKRIALGRIAPHLRPQILTQRTADLSRRLTDFARRADSALVRLVERKQASFAATARVLDTVSYKAVLARGFALINNEAGDLVRSKDEVMPGAILGVEVADGRFGVTVAGAPPMRRRRKPEDSGNQGSLF
jgi:exodeoxyribonuclease VII large subunit